MDKNLISEYFDDMYGHPNLNKEKCEFTKSDIISAIGYGQTNPDMTSFEMNNKIDEILEEIKSNRKK